MNFIITPLRWIIDLLYSWVGSYSIAIILFTLVVKLILLPLDIKQRHSMRKMQLIQPKVDEINKKYEKDPEKRSAKTMELYKKEKCNPMSGCLPMLIQMPILFAMFAVMRHIAGEQAVLMVQSVADGVAYQPEGFLWIANIWQPDNIMAKIIPSLTDLAGNLTVVNGNSLLSAENIELIRANYEIIMKPVMEVYNVGKANGWAILPLLAGASQYFTTWLMNGKQTEAQKNNPQNQQQKMMNMLIMLPMWMNFVLRICAWMLILKPDGVLDSLLGVLGFGNNHIYQTETAIVIGIVYNYLPFMVLPIYTTMAKISRSLIEAGQDLGCNGFNVLRRIILPLSVPGVITGITMVFVPAASTFCISTYLGGRFLIGDTIQSYYKGIGANNHIGSMLALVLMVIILISMAIMNKFDSGEDSAIV